MTLTEGHIAEIAEWLDCGMTCYFHRPTGTIEYHPYLDLCCEPEMWQDVIDKIEEDRGNYDRFEKMNAHEGFRVMENFAHALTDLKFQERIFHRLSNRKPFQNFKILVESSEYREDWFEFKRNAYIEFVKRQIRVE